MGEVVVIILPPGQERPADAMTTVCDPENSSDGSFRLCVHPKVTTNRPISCSMNNISLATVWLT